MTLLLGSYANDLSIVVDVKNGGTPYLVLNTNTYFDYKTQQAKMIVSDDDIEDFHYFVFSADNETKQQQQQQRSKSSILKLKNGNIALSIPYTELMKISKQQSEY